VDITRDIFRADIPPPSVLRREELLKLVASMMRVSLESLCSWCNQGGQPGFLSRILPKTPLGEYLGSSGILTPDVPEEILRTQEEIIGSIGGDALGCHDSFRNWMIDSRITEIHICPINVLADSIRRTLPDVTSSLKTASVVYFSRIFPWNPYLDREGPAWLKTPGSLPDVVRDGSVVSKESVTTIREMMEQMTSLTIDPPSLPTMNVSYVNTRLYPCVRGASSPEEASKGRMERVSLGLELEYALHPSQDKPQKLNLRELFQSIKIGTDANTPHAVYYDDPLQVSNSALRVATIVDKRRGLRLGCLDQGILKDLVSRRIRRTDLDIQFDLPVYDDSKEACLRILMSSTGSVDSHLIRPELIDEYILYHDGTCDMYIFTANTPKSITQRIELIESIVFPSKRDEDVIAYRPNQREIRAQIESGRRIPQAMRGKNDIISAKIKNTNIHSLILKETDVDDPADDVIRFHYLLVNLPADVIPGKKFKLTNDSIQKRVNILLLNGSDLETILTEMITEDITPGVLLEAIGKLPEGKTAESFRLLSMTTREVLMGALREYYNELDQDLAIRELGRLRENEGGDSMIGDVQVQNNRDGSLTTFVSGVPNMEAMYLIQHLVGRIYEQFPVILESPPVSRPVSLEAPPVPKPVPKEVIELPGEKEYKSPPPPPEPQPQAQPQPPTEPVMEEPMIEIPTEPIIEQPVQKKIEEEPEVIEIPSKVSSIQEETKEEEERPTTPFSEAPSEEEEEILEEEEEIPAEEPEKTPVGEEEEIPAEEPEKTPVGEEEEIPVEEPEKTPVKEGVRGSVVPPEGVRGSAVPPEEGEGNLGSPEEFSGEVGSVISAPPEGEEAEGDLGSLEGEEFGGFGRKSLRHKQFGRGNGGEEEVSQSQRQRLASKQATAGILFDPSYALKRLTGSSVIDTKRSTGKIKTSKTNVFGAIKEDFSGKSRYSVTCQSNIQPIVVTPEQLERFMKERPGSFGHEGMLKGQPDNAPGVTPESMKRFVIDYKGFKFICPKYWSMIDETPLYNAEVDKKEDIYVKSIMNKQKNIEVNTGKHVLRMHMANRRGDLDPDDPKDLYFPGFNVKGKPCCFFVGENSDKFDSYYDARVTKRVGMGEESKEAESLGIEAGVGAEAGVEAEAGAEPSAVAGEEIISEELPIVPSTTEAPIRQSTFTPQELQMKSRLDESMTELHKGNIDEDTRWDTRKATYLIPEQDVIELLGIGKDQCNSFLQKKIRDIEAICVGRVPDVVDYRESLFRAVLLVYRFTVASLGKDSDLFLKSPASSKDPLETFRKELTEWMTPERFRSLQGGSLMRSFLPEQTSTEELTNESIRRWFEKWELSFPPKLREEFREQLSSGGVSTLLSNWAFSHQRFLKYVSSPDEPKLLRHFWEILTKWPWQMIDEKVSETSNVFSFGVNMIVIRMMEPPMVVCPGEGPLSTYYIDNRPTIILLENSDGRYQPLVLVSREKKPGKKISLHIYGAILPNEELYTGMAPSTKKLLRDVWSTINQFSSNSRSLCEPEVIRPINDAPSYVNVVREINTATSQKTAGFVIDNLGRTTGVVFKLLPSEQLLMFPVKPDILNKKSFESQVFIGEESIQDRLPSYLQAITWLNELKSKVSEESILAKSLETIKTVIGIAETDKTADHIGYTVNGIQLATNVIVPVQEPEIYTKETLESVMKIRLADPNTIISAWDSDTNAILSSSSREAPKVDDKLMRAIRETAVAILKDDALWGAIRETRNDRRLNRIQRLKRIQESIPLSMIRIPEGITSFREDEIREQIRERITLAASQPHILETIAKGSEVLGSVKFPSKSPEELHLSYSQILTLRESDLMILDSKYTKLIETLGIGGVPDPLYISPKSQKLPIPLQGVWHDEFHYDSDRTSAIQGRDNIKEIRMLPSSSSDTFISWESIAMIMREPLRNDRLDAKGVLGVLADGWEDVFRKLGIERSSDDQWIHMTDIFRKEARGGSDTDYSAPELFLRGIRQGKYYPTLTDFYVLIQSTPTTFHIALLHGYSTGEVLTDARYPMKIIGGSPERWKEGSYGMLLRIPDKSSGSDGVHYYSAIMGIRTRGLAPITALSIPKNHLPGRVFKRVHSVSDSDPSSKEWINIRRTGWEQAMFKKKK
jgi:hypothetical protein